VLKQGEYSTVQYSNSDREEVEIEEEAVQCSAPREAEAFLGHDQATVSFHPIPIVILEDPVPTSMNRRKA
jgi:hypothetical protein